jgi:hypothetical protein
MLTELRRLGWREQFDAGPIGTLEYIRDVLGVDDDRLGEIAAWEEVPYPVRDAILICCIAEKNTGKPIEAEAVAAIAQHHGVASSPIMLALGWMPPSHYRLNETERTVLRLVAEMDRCGRMSSKLQ